MARRHPTSNAARLHEPSVREVVSADATSGFRWFEHDYPTTMARLNHHPEYELHLIRRGRGTVTVGDHAGPFAPGHLALIGPNLPHDWISDLAPGPAAERRPLASTAFAAAGDTALGCAVRHVLANIHHQVRMTDAARLAGMSETRFSRSFKRMAGRNFVDFIRRMRVTQACRLLRQTDLPIATICFDVGFGNLSNFNRQFRLEEGMAPGDYRRARFNAPGQAEGRKKVSVTGKSEVAPTGRRS